ncbi:MAG: cytochrome b N-terminal domain-containing protein [Rhodospirillaceae bacterium]
MNAVKNGVRTAFIALESLFDRVFGTAGNPLYHTGALGFFFYWIVLVSGVYVYIFFDTSVSGAYSSVERLTVAQWYAGGVMRSLHRYGSDALVVVMFVHILREFALDRLRGARWFTWITGIPVLWLVYVAGIGGYWLVWDHLAQYVALTTSEWLDSLPIFAEPIARNFLDPTALNDRFFTLLVFVHIAVPIIMLFVLWLHLQRISAPRYNPPRQMALMTLGMLLVLSFLKPALSHPPADLATVPSVIRLDWLYLTVYPLVNSWSALGTWAVVGGFTLLLTLLPWLPPLKRKPAAVVTLDYCNGCTRCAADCPYNAISMARRSDGKAFEQEAVVDAALCVTCGICVGSCPTATPFRTTAELPVGIDLVDQPLRQVRERTQQAARRCAGADLRVMVFGCDHAVAPAALERHGVAVVGLPCIAMLPPSFIDYVLSRSLADGVFLTGCPESECHNRLGVTWMAQRLAGQRDPNLRERVPRERLATCWAGAVEKHKVNQELDAFITRLKPLPRLGPAQLPAAAVASPETSTEAVS